MGKIILLLVVFFLIGIIVWLLASEVVTNDIHKEEQKPKTKLDIEEKIKQIKLEILRAESNALKGKQDAELDLEFYQQQLKATEELLKKFN